MLVNKFGFTPAKAGMIASILPLGTIIFTPLIGLFTDYRGKSASIMIGGSLIIILVHILFAFTSINPYIPMFLLGIGFSLVPAAMWPSVAKIVDNNKIGTAYGFMFSVQNLGLWLFTILIGLVLDYSNPGVTQELVKGGLARYDYTKPILMLVFLGMLGVLFAVLLMREDRKADIGLEKPNVKKD